MKAIRNFFRYGGTNGTAHLA